MKLALVRRSFSPVGGAELYLQRLIAGLASAGHELHLLAESWAGSEEKARLHPIHIRASRARAPWAFARAVDQYLADSQYDCVFSLERTLRQDIYRAGDGVHRVWIQQRRHYLPWWRTLWTGGFHKAVMELEKRTFDPQNTRYVIANSEMVRTDIQRCFQFPPDRMVLIRNGVDLSRFSKGERARTRAEYGFGPNDFVCLFVGSGWKRKGLKYVIRAIPEAQRRLGASAKGNAPEVRIKLIIAGKDRRIPAGPNVIFAGPVRGVEHLYAAADLLTFVPIYEPSANVCAEALAAGLPVVTSRFNGAAELITSPEHGTVISDPADRSTLANAIVYWARLPQRRRAPQAGAELSIQRNVAETLALIERVARSK